ncbi:30S ribosomal protein S17 [Patescibacteria group bacterium]|nr:30S ribosomal protein S17 [Patescibacteria group bacterium]
MEFIGKVVSTKMNKTVVVEVERFVVHPIYKKRIKKVKKLKVHDDVGVSVGDKVQISSTKPLSKEKHFRILRSVGT